MTRRDNTSSTIGTAVWSVLIAMALIVTMAWTGWAYYWGGDAEMGPEQPIPFSHRLHVTDKDIDCRFCHVGVDRIHTAGIPPVQTCLFCHQVVITEHPEIRRLHWHADNGVPVPWARVFEVPDHVYFTHRVHTQRAELECEDCHGPIGSMDRLRAIRIFEMGFCLDCHRGRSEGADLATRETLTDCWTCHQ